MGEARASRRIRREYDLMAFRVREILLVSSRYDAFVLEEDGHLTEQVFQEYMALSLSSAPRFTQVADEAEALELLRERAFDLVLVVAREASREVVAFGREVKRLVPGQWVVVLAFETADLTYLQHQLGPESLDGLFVWNGDARILLAITKVVEDRANAARDIRAAGVRAILVVEDSIRYYSSFLSELYPELMKQSKSLVSEGLNRLQRPAKTRTRPKILHARDFEEAEALFARFRDFVIGLICDAGFPRGGALDPKAGLELVRRCRAASPDLPVLLQSAEGDLTREAAELGVQFVVKHSPALMQTLRGFLADYLGFGPFIFRLPDGREVARASDVRELLDCIRSVPVASLGYHSQRNHFSNWLMARSEFELASSLRPLKVSDFSSLEAIRAHLLRGLGQRMERARRGVVTDFSPGAPAKGALFQRVGDGGLGGKARGVAFLNQLLAEEEERLPQGLAVRIPLSFALTTEHYERFIDENRMLEALGSESPDDPRILERFLAARLPDRLTAQLAALAEQLRGPLAVRSSSMLEDDMLHPFAGVYGTVMIPNDAPLAADRLADLRRAVKAVYATTFLKNARAYLENTGHRVEEERMGVLVQRVVGQAYGPRFYPHLAGVAHSYNFYPTGPLRPEDGVAQVVLGLGRMVVEGGEGVRFSPRHPGVVPQLAEPRLALRNSQRFFYALDLSRRWQVVGGDITANQQAYDLGVAQEDGPFRLAGGVISAYRDELTDDLDAPGTRVVTFRRLLAGGELPLAESLAALLDLVSEAMGSPVEMEFAADLGDLGRPPSAPQSGRAPTLVLLQVRPVLVREALKELSHEEFDPDTVLCRSSRALGHGHHGGIHDIVYVKPEAFSPESSPQIAEQVGQLNELLQREQRPYVLIGPGRWGSGDHWLGIPVQWAQISGAKIIVEASPQGFSVEPSQGSHFFHNLTALRLGYFTIPPGATRERPQRDSWVDWAWLADQPAAVETAHLRLVRTTAPLIAHLDGRHGVGLVAWCRRCANPICRYPRASG